MAERGRSSPILEVRGLNVFYGHSHALQGVDLSLDSGILSVVGRNGMGKTTLCQAVMGLVPATSGVVTLAGEVITGAAPTEIARRGVGYVPQGRRLWRSLTVDEHLQLVASRSGAWTIDRVYATFPRLAERHRSWASQLSGGEQQMLAISRALLLNPRLLVMDEPTEGLAPVLVQQMEEMLVQLTGEGAISVLLIEQNIGVATSISERVAIMVNGRIRHVLEAQRLAADRLLQERLLGVGRHAHDEQDGEEMLAAPDGPGREPAPPVRAGAPEKPRMVYLSNPEIPTRWSRPASVRRIEQAARTVSARSQPATPIELRPLSASGEQVVLVAGTLDTKREELRFLRDILQQAGLRTRLVDLSTSGKASSCDISAQQVAAWHPRGAAGVFTGDRGRSVAAMAEAFERWIRHQQGIAGLIGSGGSGATAMVTPAMRALPVGIPKVMISTVASGNVGQYVGPSDILMMHAVADVQGLNSITRQVQANGAHAILGMVRGRMAGAAARSGDAESLPGVGLTMFGVTTPCVQQVMAALESDYECLVFHATGTGGRSMENLVESGHLAGVVDITTTEICDLFMGGILAATEDRLGAVIRARMPYVGSCGALDMVNFGAPDTVPEKYRDRRFHEHNPQITLMRTTPEENTRMGVWIGERLNQMTAPVRFFLPEGGVSDLDFPGRPFHDPEADAALFEALEQTVRQTSSRQLVRVPHNLNDAPCAAAIAAAFRELQEERPESRRREARN